MIRFNPRQPDNDVNISKTHPLVELAWLTGGLACIATLFFLLLGFTTDWIVMKTPIKVENWIGEKALEKFPGKDHPDLQKRLEELVASLPEDSPLHQYSFSIHLSNSKDINAVALPGGRIVVFLGLLQQVKSENELAMVLAHELGHYAHRDHLRGLGRGLGIVVTTLLLFGPNNSASDILANLFLTFQMNYSREQESSADQFALILLNARYGHVGGSMDFFQRMGRNNKSHIPYLLASHPHPQNRIDNLQRLISENGFQIKDTEPLNLLP